MHKIIVYDSECISDILRALDEIISDLNSFVSFASIRVGRNELIFNLKKLVMFETHSKFIRMYFDDGSIVIKSLRSSIGKYIINEKYKFMGFIRVNRSYIVNTSFINYLHGYRLFLEGRSESVLVSQSGLQSLEKYIDFC